MAKDGKNEKGFLSGVWSVVTNPLVTIPAGLFMGAIAAPLLFDMGTWWDVFHDPSNLRAQAFKATMADYTGWIPEFVGFGSPDGLGYDLISAFIDGNYQELLAIQEASQGTDSIISSGAVTAEEAVSYAANELL